MGGHRATRKHSEARRVVGTLCQVLGVSFDDVESMIIEPGRIQVALRPSSVTEGGIKTFSIPYF